MTVNQHTMDFHRSNRWQGLILQLRNALHGLSFQGGSLLLIDLLSAPRLKPRGF
jgi:hypothetical protein